MRRICGNLGNPFGTRETELPGAPTSNTVHQAFQEGVVVVVSGRSAPSLATFAGLSRMSPHRFLAVVEPVDAVLAHSDGDRAASRICAAPYAFDHRDYFQFLDDREVAWRTRQLDRLGRFVDWWRLPLTMRTVSAMPLPTAEARCSMPTVNRKLAAVGSFSKFSSWHGVDSRRVAVDDETGVASGVMAPVCRAPRFCRSPTPTFDKLKTRRRRAHLVGQTRPKC